MLALCSLTAVSGRALWGKIQRRFLGLLYPSGMGCHQGGLDSEKLILTLRFDVGAWHLAELSGSHPECLQGTCIPVKRKLTAILNVYTPPWSNMPQGQPALTFLLPPTLVHIVTPLLTCQSGNCCFPKPHHEAAPQGGSACSHSTEHKADVHSRAHFMAPRPAPSSSSQGLATKGKHNPLRCLLAMCYTFPSSITSNRSLLEMEVVELCLSSLCTLPCPSQ